MDIDFGETETIIPRIRMVADTVLVGSVTDAAVRVTVRFPAGTGAEYVVATPVAVVEGETLPHCVAEHDTVHVTP